jgi:hypothetical protein
LTRAVELRGAPSTIDMKPIANMRMSMSSISASPFSIAHLPAILGQNLPRPGYLPLADSLNYPLLVPTTR